MVDIREVASLVHATIDSFEPIADSERMWQQFTTSLAQSMRADAAIGLRSSSHDRLHVAASYCWPTPLSLDSIAVAPDSQADFVLRHDGVHDIDVERESRFVPSRMVAEAGFRQSCTVRVMDQGRVLGLIGLQYRVLRHLSDDEHALVDASSRLLGLLLGHAERLSLHARMVDHDTLTDLANRRRIFDVIDEGLELDRPGCVVLLDLDGFKAVNDSYGHGVGDFVLQIVSQRLSAAVRPLDLVGRLSGDEFVLVIWDSDVSATMAIVERLIGHIERVISIPHGTVQISASAGVAALAGQSSTIELVSAADAAMYQAKSAGKGTVRISAPALRAAVSIESEELPVRAEPTLTALLEAIRSLEIHYQPIVTADTHEVAGFEALTRGPHGPLRDPTTLFYLAETWGQLVELELRAKELSFASPLPLNTRLFVNIDPLVLNDPSFVDRIEHLWSRRHPSINSLVVEITERHLQLRPGALIRAIERFRGLGWLVALDDVGARSSTLTALPVVQPDIVKLDMSLIDTGNVDHIAATSVALAGYRDTKGIQVIAEGIETPQDLTAAATLGASHLQGYLFGRPASAALWRNGPQIDVESMPSPQRANERTLRAISRYLEGIAGHPDTVMLATLERADLYTSFTQDQYLALARRCGLVGIAAPGMTFGARGGVHHGPIEQDSCVYNQWNVVVLHPEGGTAMSARPAPSRVGWYDFHITTDRAAVNRIATAILRCF